MTKSKEIRKFGIIALVFFGFLFVLGLWLNRPIPTCLFGVLCLLGLGFILAPTPLKPVYAVWMKIAHLIGNTVTALILTLVYYFVITPSAVIKRLFGGVPLPLKPDKSVSSYWVTRSEPAQPPERFLKRF